VEYVIVAGCMALAMVGTWWVLKRRRPITSSSTRIDPYTLGEPWRHHVAGALSAERRFAEIVAAAPPGPLRERMATIGLQVHQGVVECYAIARRGHELDGTIRMLDGGSLKRQLERADDTARASLDSQLSSLDRLRAYRNDTDQRLRTLRTQLGELVSQAAEVTVGIDHTTELGTAVDDVVQQLEALRLAVAELGGAGPGDSTS
jgi:hypothetical protein